MKFTSALTSLLAVTASVVEVGAAPSAPNVKRQSSQSLAVTGVQGQGVQPRLELRKLQSGNPDQFNLFILAMRRLMSVSQSDPLSYYQIAGIHGRPYIPWNNQWSFAGPNGFGGGYCVHVSNVFLPFHRPYLALLEQALFSHATIIANSYPSSRKQRYLNALNGFRLPYWDWAAAAPSGGNVYPNLVSSSTITVDSPTAGTQSQANPLYRYDFAGSPGNDFVYDPFATWTYTRRAPTSNQMPAAANARSQDNLVSTAVTNNRRSFADRVYNLLTNEKNFTQFSNEAWIGNTQGADSLESIHDAVHSITGQGGHMTYLDYSAFDPIFFLHHCNVDRLWAIWSTINPNSYVQPGVQQGSTYTIPAGWTKDANSALQPFTSSPNGASFSSNDVRTTSVFGYTYPELQNPSQINSAINALYGPSSSTGRKRDVDAHSKLSKRTDGSENHYTANIVSQKFKLSGSYAVYVYLGNPPTSYSDLAVASNLVGTHCVLANMNSAGRKDLDLVVSGSVPLTSALLDKCDSKELKDLTPEVVTPYLVKNLNWVVAQYDGTIIPNDQVPDLSVTVANSYVTPASNDNSLPTWGRSSTIKEVTDTKVGGYLAKWWSGADKRWTIGEFVSGGLTNRKYT